MVGLLVLCLLALLLALSAQAAGQVTDAYVRGQIVGGNGTWNAEQFGWFYYDLDEGVGGERLAIVPDGRHVEKGHLAYTSEVWTEKFEFDGWGSYQAVAILGKRYLGGYPESSFTEAVSSLEDGELREVLIDDDETRTVTSDEPLFLGDGYTLQVGGVARDGGEAHLALLRGGEVVDEAVVGINENYVYEVGEDGLPVILVHVSDIFCGRECGIVDIDGIFQVRDPPLIELKVGDVLGLLEVADLSERKIVLENHEDITLHRDCEINLLGGLMLRVLDDSSLIYYPVGAISEYGVHRIRGPVYSKNSSVPLRNMKMEIVAYAEAKWNQENFAGFYFDDDKNIGSESLVLSKTNGRNIMPFRLNPIGYPEEGLQYVSPVEPAQFEFESWGTYNVISLLGNLWFVGYGPATDPEIGNVNMLERGQIGQVILDADDRHMVSGGVLTLMEDYEVHVIDVANDSVFIMLARNGEVLDSEVIEPNSTYVYEKDVGDVDDLPIIILHVESVFSNDNEHFAIIDGIFQVSDRMFLPIERGNEIGDMVVLDANPIYILMINTDVISLNIDSEVSILPGMKIAVADNETLRYYLYTEQYVVPLPRILGVNIPQYPVSSSSPGNFSMDVLAGDIRSVTAEIVDSEGRRTVMMDLTPGGIGYGDRWSYFWRWDATALALSDDGSLLPASNVQMGVLYPNGTSAPMTAIIRFDESWRISTIQDLNDEVYYITQPEYERLGKQASYEDMLKDETLRARYIKIEPGLSKIRFYSIVDGDLVLGEENHTLWLSLDSLEPHLVEVDAPPGQYEFRLRVQNLMGALRGTGHYFNVTGPERLSISEGPGEAQTGENITEPLEVGRSELETYEETNGTTTIASKEAGLRDRGMGGKEETPAPAPAAFAALVALGMASILARRRP